MIGEINNLRVKIRTWCIISVIIIYYVLYVNALNIKKRKDLRRDLFPSSPPYNYANEYRDLSLNKNEIHN